MNLQRNPNVANFLSQLSERQSSTLSCPICGKTVEIHNLEKNSVSALCPNCDFHASVPNKK